MEGLCFCSTQCIRSFLSGASTSSWLSSDLAQSASDYADSDVVPYQVIRDVWTQMPQDERPRFRDLLRGAPFALEIPKPREKSEELKDRLKKLQELAEEKAYKKLIKDVVKEEEEAAEPFSTYKDQLGFGLHVIVTMFTGFLVGFALFRSQFQQNPVLHTVGGLLGLFLGMILETTLFIVRDYQRESYVGNRRPRPRRTPSKLETKKRV